MADGFSNKQIASALAIEDSTVKNHVHNMLVKPGVHGRVRVVSLLQNTRQAVGSRSLDLQGSREIYAWSVSFALQLKPII
jgi:hypothetical protein